MSFKKPDCQLTGIILAGGMSSRNHVFVTEIPTMALTNSIVPRIEPGVARQMADAGEAVLVDVRTKATFDQAHIAGAISMPASEVLERYHELPTDKLVIFY